MKSVAIIGAGITGVTTAYALTQRGFRVTLFEQNRYPAMETSFANGGQLSASNAEVWTHPSTLLKGLRWMLRSDAPLLINPKPSWHKLSWFVEFASNITRYEHNTVATVKLALEARDHFFSWAQAEGLNFNLVKRGILHIYRNKTGFDHASRVNRLLKAGGLDRRAVTADEMRAIEPALSGVFYGGYYTESDSTGDIHQFTVQLSAAAERLGAGIRFQQQVERLESDGQRARVVLGTPDGESAEVFDAVVVCAGVASRAFASQLGDRVNIYPVKGYSITLALSDEKSQQAAPWVSLLDDETKLVTSRLGTDRFRVAGTAEFNGLNKDIRADRIKPLIEWVHNTFPEVSTRQAAPWTGLRPMMPDMMPRVGQGKKPNVFYNTGHGHLGWTLCAATAYAIAQKVAKHYAVA